MHLIVGLGNPGDEYAHTRHNAGFDTVDRLGEELGARYWKTECGALTAKVSYRLPAGCPAAQGEAGAAEDIILAKPQSFMNCSGGPVKQLCAAYRVPRENLIVIHDDLDINPDRIRVKCGGGNAGHNGLKSITEKLGTPDWLRVRVGIGRPPGRMPVVDYVLQAPKKEAREDFEQAQDMAAQAALFLIAYGLEGTQQKYN